MRKITDIIGILWLIAVIPIWLLLSAFATDNPNSDIFSVLLQISVVGLLLALPSIMWFVFLRNNRGGKFRLLFLLIGSLPFLIIGLLILINIFGF